MTKRLMYWRVYSQVSCDNPNVLDEEIVDCNLNGEECSNTWDPIHVVVSSSEDDNEKGENNFNQDLSKKISQEDLQSIKNNCINY